MHSDKMLVSRDEASGIGAVLLPMLKRAVVKGDKDAIRLIHAQVEGMKVLAGKDRALFNAALQLERRCASIEKSGGAAFVLETKHYAEKRGVIEADVTDALASADPVLEVSGYGATFNNADNGNDIILPGAFTQTLREWRMKGRLPVMLASHDMGVFPIGAWTSMTEDSHGLKVKGVIADTPRGREAAALISMRPSALDGLSIGFTTSGFTFDKAGHRLISDISLWELSIVSLPMNEQARLDTPKASTSLDAALKNLRRISESLDAGDNILSFPSRFSSDDEAEAVAAMNRLAQSLRR